MRLHNMKLINTLQGVIDGLNEVVEEANDESLADIENQLKRITDGPYVLEWGTNDTLEIHIHFTCNEIDFTAWMLVNE